MVGVRIPGTPIACDVWSWSAQTRYYFLSHMHADHTIGLSPSWDHGRLVCTETTRALLLQRFGSALAAHIHVVPVGETTSIALDADQRYWLNVTVLDANHCPGSVVFVFEGYFGKVCYTGDFRFRPELLEHPVWRGAPIDTVYLDNTWLDPRYQLPTQQEAAQAIVRFVRQRFPEHRVFLGIDSLGKEELMLYLARNLCSLVAVTAARMRELDVLPSVFADAPWAWELDAIARANLASEAGDADAGDDAGDGDGKDLHPRLQSVQRPWTTEQTRARLQVVPRWALTQERVRRANQDVPTIGIMPTGHASGSQSNVMELGEDAPIPDGQLVFYVPYSLHSSFQELQAFIKAVQPGKVVPIVPKSSSGHEHVEVRMFLEPMLQPTRPAVTKAQAMRPQAVQQVLRQILSTPSTAGLEPGPGAGASAARPFLPVGVATARPVVRRRSIVGAVLAPATDEDDDENDDGAVDDGDSRSNTAAAAAAAVSEHHRTETVVVRAPKWLALSPPSAGSRRHARRLPQCVAETMTPLPVKAEEQEEDAAAAAQPQHDTAEDVDGSAHLPSARIEAAARESTAVEDSKARSQHEGMQGHTRRRAHSVAAAMTQAWDLASSEEGEEEADQMQPDHEESHARPARLTKRVACDAARVQQDQRWKRARPTIQAPSRLPRSYAGIEALIRSLPDQQ